MAALTSDPIPMLSGSMTAVRTVLVLPPIGLVLVAISTALVIREWYQQSGTTVTPRLAHSAAGGSAAVHVVVERVEPALVAGLTVSRPSARDDAHAKAGVHW